MNWNCTSVDNTSICHVLSSSGEGLANILEFIAVPTGYFILAFAVVMLLINLVKKLRKF